MTDLPKVDRSVVKVKDEAVINGPERLEIDESMSTTVATGTGRPRRRCLPCRCSRFTATVVGLVVLSGVLAALLIAAAVRLSRRPTCGAADDPATSLPTDRPGSGRVLSTVADDGSPLPWTDIRLPRSVVPESYALHLRVDPSRDWFHGAVSIDVMVKEDTRMIVLHASSITVDVDSIHVTRKVIPV